MTRDPIHTYFRLTMQSGSWPTCSYSLNDFQTPKGSVRTGWELQGHFRGVTLVTKDLEFFPKFSYMLSESSWFIFTSIIRLLLHYASNLRIHIYQCHIIRSHCIIGMLSLTSSQLIKNNTHFWLNPIIIWVYRVFCLPFLHPPSRGLETAVFFECLW